MTKFAQLSSKLADRGAENPDALAAYIGRKKLGKKRFDSKAKAGAKRAALDAARDKREGVAEGSPKDTKLDGGKGY